MKTIAFLTNSISFGGVEVAMYDYADYNETLLGNKSIVITRNFKDTHGPIYEKFEKRFPVFYIKTRDDINKVIRDQKLLKEQLLRVTKTIDQRP
mgnify:CR=1 FL=1